jgi:hypothetical protein
MLRCHTMPSLWSEFKNLEKSDLPAKKHKSPVGHINGKAGNQTCRLKA